MLLVYNLNPQEHVAPKRGMITNSNILTGSNLIPRSSQRGEEQRRKKRLVLANYACVKFFQKSGNHAHVILVFFCVTITYNRVIWYSST